MRRVRLFAITGLLLAACTGGYGTPAATLETLKAAASSGDSATLYGALNAEARAFHRDNIRIWKARIARGDDPAAFGAELPLPPDVIRDLPEEEAATRWIGTSSPIVRMQDWLDSARIVGDPTVRSETEQGLRLRGRDGVERELWFLLEDGRWTFDILQSERALR